MRTLSIVTFAALAVACDTPATSDVEARVRNAPPAACAEGDFAVCPAMAMLPCADGSEPVIDFASDCCPHYSCQPLCVSAEICTPTPAPICPWGTELWIGTALEDCCPAYRCEPTTVCSEDARDVCPLGIPWCGEGLEPMIIGETGDCCPIYQCPCNGDLDGDGWVDDTLSPDGTVSSDPSLCGCTYPVCAPGEQLTCLGDNICGYPCECQPFAGECMGDDECGVGLVCDTSACLPAPGCDTASGVGCVTVCYGICVPRAGEGCGADLECPAGQFCSMECSTWECDSATDPTCGCVSGDPACDCRSDGVTTYCGMSSCTGVCLPAGPVCEPTVVATCEEPLIDCVTVIVGQDPDTCCPIYECSTCGVPVPGAPVACAVAACPAGTDILTFGVDSDCCPLTCCADATGVCVTR